MMNWAVYVEVAGYADEESALIAARETVRRDCFHLYSVWECSQCAVQNRQIDALGKLADAATS